MGGSFAGPFNLRTPPSLLLFVRREPRLQSTSSGDPVPHGADSPSRFARIPEHSVRTSPSNLPPDFPCPVPPHAFPDKSPRLGYGSQTESLSSSLSKARAPA